MGLVRAVIGGMTGSEEVYAGMRKRISLFLMGITVMMLLVSCGKEEKRQESKTDEYVNVTNQVSLDDMMVSAIISWQEAGGKLYCSVDSCIYDVPVAQALELQMTQEIGVTDVGSRIRKFCVDGDGNIYWEPMFQLETKYLHKYLTESGEDVQIPLDLGDESIGAIVSDQHGRIYLLLDSQILVLDEDGNVVSGYSGEKFRFQSGGSKAAENLVADSQGNLFYLQNVAQDTRVRVLYQGAQKWVGLTGLPETFGVEDFFLAEEGKIFISGDDTLYEYDLKNAESTAVLRYSESNLDKNDIRRIIYVDEEHFLALCTNIINAKTEMYLLTRTPAEEVAPKKEIILASLSPSAELKGAVAAFNRISEEYTVVIDRYGNSDEYWGTYEGYQIEQAAQTRLDGSLVSSDPPALLDLGCTYNAVAIYAEKDALADLYPYFERSDVLDIGDYLENVVEGYTVNGKLVCLPTTFYIQAVVGRTSQVGSDPGWTFDDLNAVLEEYPDMKLLARNYMFFYFLYRYYINTFVDYETGECSFDSDGFREFVQWIERYKLPEGERLSSVDYVPADVLLTSEFFTDFYRYDQIRVRFGEDITFMGHVTKDGTPAYEYQPKCEVGIVENSKDKDGAWAFLEYLISSKGSYQGYFQDGFPTNRNELMKMAEDEGKAKEITTQPDGTVNTGLGYWRIGDDSYPRYAPTRKVVNTILEVIDNIDFTQVSSAPSSMDGNVHMLLEELEPYYLGQKSLEEVTQIFNNRMQLRVDERR